MPFHSPLWQNLREKIKRNRYVRFFLWVLAVLYLLAVFADFIAAYTPNFEQRAFSFAPPARIRLVDAEGELHRPFIYRLKSHVDQYRRRTFTEERDERHPIRFIVRGEMHHVLGLLPTKFHLFGTSGEQPLYLFGADNRGRDIFSRILYGARVSLSIGLVGAFITFFLGTLMGCIAGYVGGRVDAVLMRLCELMLLIPGVYLLFALRALFPPTVSSDHMYLLIVVILSLIGWAGLARVIRGMVLSLKEKEYVLAARALGQSAPKIIALHIAPHLSSYLVVSIMFSVPLYILGESILSFLGLGILDPSVSWGLMLKDASNIAELTLHPWILFPVLFLVATILAFNVLGDFLRDILDPYYKNV